MNRPTTTRRAGVCWWRSGGGGGGGIEEAAREGMVAKAARGGVAGDGLRLIEDEGVVMCTYWGWADIPWC